ncbi:MAG: 4'-phosphopantetheinyl transferase superfamily protein [Isosphaeraceae bacterium]
MAPVPRLDLAPGIVHVWRIRLDLPEELLAQIEAVLAPDELARADRFKRPGVRSRFVAGRGSLRNILGAQVCHDPAALVFRYGLHGKPSLAVPDGTGLEFNLTHSGDLALCALTIGRAMGVDVEQLRPMTEAERIIDRYFTEREQAAFLRHGPDDRPSAFFRGWTRKEAFLKVTGDGLTRPLDSFEVDLDDRPTGLLLRVGDDPDAASRWSLVDINAGPGYIAALAVEGPLDRLTVDDWPVG